MNRDAPIGSDDLLVHTDALRRLACALLRDKGLAEDVVQQTFVIALENPRAEPDGLGAWLRRVVRHRAVDLQRTSERRKHRERSVARPEAVPCHTTTAEGIALQREVVDAVGALSDPYRTAIYLRYFEGLPPRMIAAREAVPVKTVKTWLWRGLEMLRTRLDEQRGSRSCWAGMLLPLSHGTHPYPLSGGLLEASAVGALAMKSKTVVWICIGLFLLAMTARVVDWSDSESSIEPDRDSLGTAPSTDDGPFETLSSPVEQSRRATVEEPNDVGGAATTSATTLLVQCLWSDGTPARGVGVVVETVAAADFGSNKSRFVSDVDGKVVVNELVPGRVSVRSDRGGSTETLVNAGKRTSLQLHLRPGVDVSGIVVDVEGSPVPGASVWLAGGATDWVSGFPIAACGPDGRFLLRAVAAEHSLWASAKRHGPSVLVDLESRDVSSGSVEIELSLSKVGAALHGRVVDARGGSVEGARVALGAPPDPLMTRVDGSQAEVVVPRIAISDDGGRFAFEGVTPGLQPIAVQAEGWPIWRQDVVVEVEDTARLLVELEHGALVTGIVYDDTGKPLEGAAVRALPAPFAGSFPGQGPSDEGRTFPHPGARTDARGAYQLPPLAAGQAHLYASKGERRGGTLHAAKNGVFLGSAQETLTVHAGQELIWSPRISLGSTIEGRVTYADGAPMQRVFVHAQQQINRRTKTTTTDADGKFRITSLEPGSYRVSVVLRGAPDGAAPLVRTDVRPDSGTLELRADFTKDQSGTGRASIRFKDDGERVEGTPAIVFATDRNWFRAGHLKGVYSSTLRPGRYRPIAMAGAIEVATGPWFELNQGDDLDLGTLISRPGGHLLIHVDRESAPNGDLEVMVHSLDGLPRRTRNATVLKEGQNQLRVENLSAGTTELSLWGDHCLSETRVIDVVPDSTSEVEIVLRAGALREFEFVGMEQSGWGSFEFTIRDASGAEVYKARRDESTRSQRFFRYAVSLPLGRFTVEAHTAGGLKYSGDVEFHSLDASPGRMTLELQ